MASDKVDPHNDTSPLIEPGLLYREDLRKNLLVDKKLQFFFLRLIAGCSILCIVATLFSSFGFFFLMKKFYEKSNSIELLQMIESMEEFSWVYVVLLAAGLLFSFCIIIYAWLVSSNRLAGPVQRIQAHVDEYLGGSQYKEIKLRKNDELKALAESINKLVEKLTSSQK